MKIKISNVKRSLHLVLLPGCKSTLLAAAKKKQYGVIFSSLKINLNSKIAILFRVVNGPMALTCTSVQMVKKKVKKKQNYFGKLIIENGHWANMGDIIRQLREIFLNTQTVKWRLQ